MICKKIHMVHGELDPVDLQNLKEIEAFTIGSFRVILLSSYLAFSESMICMKQREYDADIVVIGGSHNASIKKIQDFHVIDPGTATGAFNSTYENPPPSFIILEILGYIANATIYTLEKDGSISSRTETFQKQI
ncbi:Vacuolar protein sorting-associated protein 29 [Histomonas meleagridis]|uniref:Vacuolar protein sorting-associated protein 29 n=1 Tax=Histomonas meleagridis TaxID=135588 RepID=UPI00355953EC|nr:Vacuolar protein sorting-associated protein 29 [Histomonas meleagridis]KAH0798704.1 Vacuolar protein sorting-associated protein 29 [Histomonas meleagridis]